MDASQVAPNKKYAADDMPDLGLDGNLSALGSEKLGSGTEHRHKSHFNHEKYASMSSVNKRNDLTIQWFSELLGSDTETDTQTDSIRRTNGG